MSASASSDIVKDTQTFSGYEKIDISKKNLMKRWKTSFAADWIRDSWAWVLRSSSSSTLSFRKSAINFGCKFQTAIVPVTRITKSKDGVHQKQYFTILVHGGFLIILVCKPRYLTIDVVKNPPTASKIYLQNMHRLLLTGSQRVRTDMLLLSPL